MNRCESLKFYVYIYIYIKYIYNKYFNAVKQQNDTLCGNNITVKSSTPLFEKPFLFLRG